MRERCERCVEGIYHDGNANVARWRKCIILYNNRDDIDMISRSAWVC